MNTKETDGPSEKYQRTALFPVLLRTLSQTDNWQKVADQTTWYVDGNKVWLGHSSHPVPEHMVFKFA